MTEEEAKTKWCPMARSVGLYGKTKVGPPCNRVFTDGEIQPEHRNPPYARCLSSECMMWRWVGVYVPPPPDRKYPMEGYDIPSKTEGYCGLAGKP